MSAATEAVLAAYTADPAIAASDQDFVGFVQRMLAPTGLLAKRMALGE